MTIENMERELLQLRETQNLRSLPALVHEGKFITRFGRCMLNLSSNDYLGLATDIELRRRFLMTLTPNSFLPSSSSSRLLTGNFAVYDKLEDELAKQYGTEAALVFNCGFHANTGILPAVSDAHTLILADKLVHASLIDGIRLCTAKCIRYRHNDLVQLERLVTTHAADYDQIIIVTESIFSMDGDRTDLPALVRLKHRYPHVQLYVDEAHGFGVFGAKGLGVAEEDGVIRDIDYLVGTFGKAGASAGAFVVCRRVIREYLINRMRPFIFTTALPPVNIAWTLHVMRHLADEAQAVRRRHVRQLGATLRQALIGICGENPSLVQSASQIVPFVIGPSAEAVRTARQLQSCGFYVLPVRPPTVPEGTARLRFSLTSDLSEEELEQLIAAIKKIRSENA